MTSLSSPTKTSIEEANKHLLLLHKRVEDLENTLVKQSNEFSRKEREKEQYFSELIRQKSELCQNLQDEILQCQIKISALQESAKEKDQVIEELKDKSRVLDELLQCKPILESMVKLMDVYESCSDPETVAGKNSLSHPSMNGHVDKSHGRKVSTSSKQRDMKDESGAVHL